MTYVLLDHACEVSTTDHPFAALSLLRMVRPDLILLNAGAFDTFAFLAAQKLQPDSAGIPVLVATRWPLEKLPGFPSASLLPKPFSFDDLRRAIVAARGRESRQPAFAQRAAA